MFLKIFLLLALVEGIMWNICVTLFKILARGFGDVTLHGGGGGGGGPFVYQNHFNNFSRGTIKILNLGQWFQSRS